MEKCEKIWYNGEMVNWADAKVHVLSHTLNYGMGVFEGIRVYQTPKGPAIFRLKEHAQRLLDGCKVLGFEMVFNGKEYGLEEIMEAIKETVRINPTADYLKPCVFLSGEEVSLNPIGVETSMVISCINMGSYLGDSTAAGAKIITSSWQRPDNLCSPAGAKVNGVYVTSCLAKMEAVRSGANEAVMLNSVGHVAECTGENIFVYKNGVIMTPQSAECILEGITRRSIIEIARDLGYTVEETQVSRTQLVTADEVWMTGTAAEVAPVTMIDNRQVGNGVIGEVAKAIHARFHEIASGKIPERESWLDYVN